MRIQEEKIRLGSGEEIVIIIDDNGESAWNVKSPHWQWNPKPDLCLYVANDEGPVSALRCFNRVLWIPPPDHPPASPCRINILGIGGVYTIDTYRMRGYCSIAMQAIIRYAALSHIAALVLFTATAWSFYKKFGFKPIKEVNQKESLWALSLANGLEIQAGDWRLLPGGHF